MNNKHLLLFSLLFFQFYLLKSQTIDTIEVIQIVDSLLLASDAETAEGDYEKALEISALAEQLIIEHLDKGHQGYINLQHQLGFLYLEMGDYEKAVEYYVKEKELMEQYHGDDHPEYGRCLNKLGLVYYEMGDYENAEQLFLAALPFNEKNEGKQSHQYGLNLENIANLYTDIGRYEEAEPLYFKVVEIRGNTVGENHAHYAQVLDNLAILYKLNRQYEKAEQYFLEAKEIRQKVLGEKHPDYAASLNNLGILYKDISSFEKAELYFLESMAIRKKTLGERHPLYAQSMFNLGGLYSINSNYEKAELLFLETTDIVKETMGVEHPIYALCLQLLSSLYHDMGNYEKAESIILEAKEICANAWGKNHASYAGILLNLGHLYHNMGKYQKAEAMYEEAASICRETEGKDLCDYPGILNNLGNLYTEIAVEKAEALYLESLALNEKELGKNHIAYVKGLGNLATFYQGQGKAEKANSLYLEAKEISEKVLGKEHPDYAWLLKRMATGYDQSGDYENAESLYSQAIEIDKSLLLKAARHLSEKELMGYLQTFISAQNQHFSFAERQSTLLASSYDNTLFYKGFLLHAIQKINRQTNLDSTSIELSYRLKSYQRRLAAEYAKPLVEREGVATLEEKANHIEKDLTRYVADMGEELRQVTWTEVQAKLQAGEAALEFIHYQYYDPIARDSIRYAALLLRPGDLSPTFIPLFAEKSLEALLQKEGNRRASYVNNLYVHAGEALYGQIWQALEPLLKEVQTIYFSSAGLLHQLNIGALPMPMTENKTLSDHYQFHRLNSTRDLVFKDHTKATQHTAILYGGIHYDYDQATMQEQPSSTSIHRGQLDFSQTDTTLRGGSNWEYLSSTSEEITALGAILKNKKIATVSHKANSATEESFKALSKTAEQPSPSIIHIATHGYFFPNPSSPETKSPKIAGERAEPIFKISDHPMIRSGLLFAGANYAWQNGKPVDSEKEDGILTAYEISQLDLSDTELVVLSACETGLGDLKGNEGVYGLQRAFKIAGVKNIIMSLWQVPDYQTKELMIRFYENWLEEKMEIRTALLAAQHSMRDEGYEPYHWAGFVVLE